MPRKHKKQDDLDFIDQIIEAYKKTTHEERQKVAQDWCLGDYNAADSYKVRGLVPIALIIAALDDIEHPLLVSPGRGLMYSAVGCAVVVLTVEIRNEAVDIPYPKKSVHRDPVYSL